MRKFAVFDIDGTVIRWQLYHAVVDEFAQRDYISEADHDKIRQARMLWKCRTNATSFDEYEREVVRLHNKALSRISYDKFINIVESVFDEYKEQTYTYTRDLIRHLKSEGYLLFAISASQQEIVRLMADYYGFDDCGGSVYETRAGKFTGTNHILKRDRKPEYLKDLVAKHHATYDGSIGVGDSDGDIPMLTAVENPIAFNPNHLLFEHAKTHGWKVVLERKNMTYELVNQNGRYILAD